MTWPAKVYAATRLSGIYLSEDFGGPLATMPTWRAINDGLPAGSVTSFWLDTYRNGAVQYAIDDSVATVWQRTDGAWSALLTSAQGASLTGVAAGTCLRVACDPITGYIYVLFGYVAYPGSNPWMLRSVDAGATWTAVEVTGDTFSTYWAGYPHSPVDAYNGVVAFSRRTAGTSSIRQRVSADHGQTWVSYGVGSQAALFSSRVAPLGAGLCYGDGWDHDLRVYSTSQAPTVVADAYNFYPKWCGAYWFNMADADHMIIRHTAALSGKYAFYETRDSWATVEDAEPALPDVNQLTQIAPYTEYGTFVLGRCDDSAISGLGCVRVSEDLVTTVDRSGPNNASAPYTDSIPGDCGGLIDRGLWAMGVQPGHWQVYSCRFQEVTP